MQQQVGVRPDRLIANRPHHRIGSGSGLQGWHMASGAVQVHKQPLTATHNSTARALRRARGSQGLAVVRHQVELLVADVGRSPLGIKLVIAGGGCGEPHVLPIGIDGLIAHAGRDRLPAETAQTALAIRASQPVGAAGDPIAVGVIGISHGRDRLLGHSLQQAKPQQRWRHPQRAVEFCIQLGSRWAGRDHIRRTQSGITQPHRSPADRHGGFRLSPEHGLVLNLRAEPCLQHHPDQGFIGDDTTTTVSHMTGDTGLRHELRAEPSPGPAADGHMGAIEQEVGLGMARQFAGAEAACGLLKRRRCAVGHGHRTSRLLRIWLGVQPQGHHNHHNTNRQSADQLATTDPAPEAIERHELRTAAPQPVSTAPLFARCLPSRPRSWSAQPGC